MNRTDRLYALVEELRARAPQPVTAAAMAERFEVSVRTIERDLSALQQAGVPIYATPGRKGGYAIDKAMTLPPLNFTAAEATAMALALARDHTTPFTAAARSALQRIMAAMSEADTGALQELADRVRVYRHVDSPGPHAVPGVVERAIVERAVLRIDYVDRVGVETIRVIEPVALLAVDASWYLAAWCRMREGPRSFRLDRIHGAKLTGEQAPTRAVEEVLPRITELIPRASVFE